MKINWRNKQYNYEPRTLIAGKDKIRQSDIGGNIYAFDTETITFEDRCEPQCFQISNPIGGECIQYIPPNGKALEQFIDYWFYNFAHMECDSMNRHAFMFGHNLMFDWLQLIKHYPDLISIARTGIGLAHDYKIWHKEYYVILRKGGLFVGNAPHFTLKIGTTSRNWVNLHFRDTFSYFPTSLAKLGKQLKLDSEKLERQEDLGKIDYRNSVMTKEKEYFEEYSKLDAKITRLVAETIRDLHSKAQMQRLRVSAPSFAINYLYHSIPEGTAIRSGVSDPSIMQLVLDTYSGGRTGGIFHGEVSNISVLDFHSSYPCSMTSLPSFSETMEYLRMPNLDELNQEDLVEVINECPCFMRISGEETDNKYPALVTNKDNKLIPVYGKFENIATTGVEALVGIKSGTLSISKIHDLVCLIETDANVPLVFKIFSETAYKRKQTAEKGSPEYNSAKLVLNSAYGKLIESRTETMVSDDVKNLVLPYVQGMETKFGKMYYEEYIKTLNEESEQTFDEIYPDLVEEIVNGFGEELVQYANFGRLSLTELNYGRYVIPAAASLITATSRARLLGLMKCTQALYWDTDSVFIPDYEEEKVKEQLKQTIDWFPEYVTPLRFGEELGDLDCEIYKSSGYLAGTKRYYLSDEEGNYKKGVHGIPTAPFDKTEEMIRKLATGEDNIYKGRERPKGVKEEKNVREIGRFESKEYVSKFKLDDRLNWVRVNNGWEGSIKEYES